MAKGVSQCDWIKGFQMRTFPWIIQVAWVREGGVLSLRGDIGTEAKGWPC